MDMDDIEIWVHISAPTTRKDDDRYRAEAAAYSKFDGVPVDASHPQNQAVTQSYESNEDVDYTTSFEFRSYYEGSGSPGLRHPLERLEALQTQWRSVKKQTRALTTGSEPASGAKIALIDPQIPGNDAARGEDLPLYVEDTQLALYAIESQLFDSPDKPPRDNSMASNQERSSTPSNLGDPNTDSHTPKLPLLEPSSGSESTDYSGHVAFDGFSSQLPVTFSLTGQPGKPFAQGVTNDRVCQAEPSGKDSDGTERSSNENVEKSILESALQSSLNDELYILEQPQSGSIVVLDTPKIAAAETAASPITIAINQTMRHSHTASRATKVQKEAPMGPEKLSLVSGTGNSPHSPDFSSLPREVLPPPAKVGFGSAVPWPSQSTPMLTSLLTNPNTQNRYRPISVSRPVRRAERGYWSVDTSSWPLQYQFDFWANMADFIEKGRGGWGVWMTRGEEDQPPPITELGEVHVWCWGELVEHIYLLIWTLSSSKVITSHAEWRDGLGRLVVKMPIATINE